MMTKLIKRAGDNPVRKPDGGYLADEAESVRWSPYWQRRLDEGDIVIAPKAEKDIK
jgi:hypothetical protein